MALVRRGLIRMIMMMVIVVVMMVMIVHALSFASASEDKLLVLCLSVVLCHATRPTRL